MVVEDEHGFAPLYGRMERGVTIRASRTARDQCVLAAFVGTAAHDTRVGIVELAGGTAAGAWIESRFDLQTGDSRRQISIWFPSDGNKAEPAENWPQPCIEQLVTSCVG
jgi:hypothetical protein